MPKLSPRTVEAARPGEKDLILFDSELPGFGLKVTPHGSKIFLYQYWSPVERGKRRRYNIGALGDTLRRPDNSTVAITPHMARAEAERLRGIVLDKRDPHLERDQQARAAEADRIAARAKEAALRSVREIAVDMMADVVAQRRSPRTIVEYQRLLNKHLLNLRVTPEFVFGDRPVAEVGKSDVEAVRRQKGLSARPVLANRVQQLGRALLNFAERVEARPFGLANPFGGKRWNAERETRQPLTRDEITALHDSLAVEDDGTRGGSVDAIRFLLYSGWRKGEALSLRWDAIDFEAGKVTLGRTKTGQSVRPLAREALAVLGRIPKHGRGAFVFVAPRDANLPRTAIKRTWLRVRARAGITKPLHSLRHTMASIALSEGVPLAAVGAILGHRDVATTARYAKMEGSAAKTAADVAGAAIGRAVQSTDVLSITTPRKPNVARSRA